MGTLEWKTPPGGFRTVSNIITHPGYDPDALLNDIGIFVLTDSIQFSDTISKIPISCDKSCNKGIVKTSGWGMTSDKLKSVAQSLQEANLTLIDKLECEKTYGSLKTYKIGCASTIDKVSTCSGDSGSAWCKYTSKGLELMGVTSFGSTDGCEKQHPVTCTCVAQYLDWIKEETGYTGTC